MCDVNTASDKTRTHSGSTRWLSSTVDTNSCRSNETC